MPSNSIIEHFDILKNCAFCLVPGSEGYAPYQLRLNGSKEALGCRIIVAVASKCHALADAALAKKASKILTISEASVTSMGRGNGKKAFWFERQGQTLFLYENHLELTLKTSPELPQTSGS